MSMLKRWSIYIIILAATIAFYGIYEGYISYLLLVITVLFPFFSLLLSLFGMLRVRISLMPLPPEIKRGETVKAVMHINHRSLLPLSMITITYIAKNMTFCNEDNKTTFTLHSCVNCDVSLPLDTEHIGCIFLAVAKIKVYDYLGLFCISLINPVKRRIMILPNLIRPDPMPVLPMDKIGGKGLKPKLGGGFAEDYDLREYRIGDPMNLIHWKLTLKLDDLIVKEPLVSEKGKIFICFNLFGTPEELDSVFGQVSFISHILIQRMIEFNLCCYGKDGKIKIVEIQNITDFYKYILAVFSEPVKAEGKTIDDNAFRDADWHYFVHPNLDIKEEETA